jgi:flagellar basal body-associated protein FliL
MAERGRSQFNSKLKEELKREIKQELLEEFRKKEINPDFKKKENLEDNDIYEAKESKETHEKKPKKPIRLLVFLVLIVLVLDMGILFFYYNPNFFKATSGLIIKNTSDNESGNCSDGTRENTCSKTKPYFCANGKLVEAGYTCGCPNGYVRQFQSCKLISS